MADDPTALADPTVRTTTLLRVALVAAAALVLPVACSGDEPTAATTTTSAVTTTTTTAPHPTTTVAGERMWVIDLDVGECFDERIVAGQAGATLNAVFRVDCAGPHDNEIYGTATMPQTIYDPFPGDDAVGAFADQACFDAFEGFIGLQWELSVYEFGYLAPTVESWQVPDRNVLCFVFHRSGIKVEGTAEGDRTCGAEFGAVGGENCTGIEQG